MDYFTSCAFYTIWKSTAFGGGNEVVAMPGKENAEQAGVVCCHENTQKNTKNFHFREN